MRWVAGSLLVVSAVVGCDRATPTGTSNSTGNPPVVVGSLRPLRFAPGAPPLQTYDTTVTIVQGRHNWLEIFHEDLTWFITLDIPPSAQFVSADGTPVPSGEAVSLRARVDSPYVSFEFQPHGSYFTGSRPVELWVGLKHLDLEGRSEFPDIWYQADSNEPWTALPTEVRLSGQWLVVQLTHFSNYAVAW